jgi:repressor LexA
MEELTDKQAEIFEFMRSHIEAYRRPPSMREIAAHFDLASTNGVSQHLDALERKGWIRRSRYISRGIELMCENPRSLAVAGTIAAGEPIEAIEDIEEIDLDDMFMHRDCYLLKVKGSSMIDDCIQEGDYVVVNPDASADSGRIVVAVIDGEATIKRFYREKGRIRLQPANSEMNPIYPDPGHLEIRGVVVGIVRKY